MTDGYVAALLHEREGYKAARMWDRMRQVDVELAKFGIAVADDEPEDAVEVDAGDEPETATAAAPEKAVRPPGRPRRAR